MAVVLCGCTGPEMPHKSDTELQDMKRMWVSLLHEGRVKEVVELTRPYYFRNSDKDKTARGLAALYLAEAYTVLENADSARYFLNAATPLMRHIDNAVMSILYYNVRGALSLKYDLDFPGSLDSYNQGYKAARKAGNVRGMITMLTSIVYIYYVLDDPHGMEFAREGKAIVSHLAHPDTVAEAQACVAMGLMLAANRRPVEALRELDRADTLIRAGHLNQIATLADVARGDILTHMRDFGSAERAYDNALRFMPWTEHSFGVMALSRYGAEKEKRGDLIGADSLYRRGLELSVKYSNLEFRGDILLALAKIRLRSGRRTESLEYFNRYHTHIDSLHRTRMVQDFNNLILTNRNLEKQAEVQKYKIESMRTRQVAVVSISLLVLLSVGIATVLHYYRKLRRLHRAQTNRLLAQTKAIVPANTADEEETEGNRMLTDLFAVIDARMKKEELWRRKNLSLESLAAEVDSNRTYVSRAVNAGSGVSFSTYVNNFRIAEAVRLLSDAGEQILIKQLADGVGFSTESAFYKIFKRETGMSPKEFRQSVIYLSKEKE